MYVSQRACWLAYLFDFGIINLIMKKKLSFCCHLKYWKVTFFTKNIFDSPLRSLGLVAFFFQVQPLEIFAKNAFYIYATFTVKNLAEKYTRKQLNALRSQIALSIEMLHLSSGEFAAHLQTWNLRKILRFAHWKVEI